MTRGNAGTPLFAGMILCRVGGCQMGGRTSSLFDGSRKQSLRNSVNWISSCDSVALFEPDLFEVAFNARTRLHPIDRRNTLSSATIVPTATSAAPAAAS